MAQTVRPALQVIAFIRRLAPEPRRALKQGLRELAKGRGDVWALEGVLAGYHRLKVGRYRVIFSYAADGAIEAIFVEERKLVYEVFEAEFVRKLRQQ